MVFAAGVAVIGFAGYMLSVGPQIDRHKRLEAQIARTQADTATMRAQVQQLLRTLAQDPNAEARSRIAQLRQQIEELDASVRAVQRGLVSPKRMAAVLEEMLTRNRRVELVGLRTLPVTALVERATVPAAEDAAAAQLRNVYKHGVEITLQGSYLDLLDYVARLEKLPWQMFWARTRMDASDYPRVRLTLTLYTLSLDRAWLVV
jgi:MSHA biogenesis protein MshJ